MGCDEFTKFDISGVGVGSPPSAAEDVVFAGVEYFGQWVVGCHVVVMCGVVADV